MNQYRSQMIPVVQRRIRNSSTCNKAIRPCRYINIQPCRYFMSGNSNLHPHRYHHSDTLGRVYCIQNPKKWQRRFGSVFTIGLPVLLEAPMKQPSVRI